MALTAVLFGASSIARANSFERYETPVLAWLSPPPSVLNEGSDAAGNWAVFVDAEHRIRLSLDDESFPRTGRPFRTTLLPVPVRQLPSPDSPPVPDPSDLIGAEPSPSAPQPAPLASEPNALPEPAPNFDVDRELRHIRLSFDSGVPGALGRPEPHLRPIRLFLDSSAPSSPAPRPFRSVLD